MQLRAALQETNRQLEQRVQERTAELQNALRKLSELNQLKSNIVANISHELRTPLTHIKGYLELLMAEVMGPLSSDQANALEVMQRSTERLERQIEDLILFSIASRGEFSLRLVSRDVDDLFEAIVKRSQTKALEKGSICRQWFLEKSSLSRSMKKNSPGLWFNWSTMPSNLHPQRAG
jgi:signal transduction histidine kinase